MDYIDRQAAIDDIMKHKNSVIEGCKAGSYTKQIYGMANDHVCELINILPSADVEPVRRWIPCTQPPQDERNVFLAHGTNNFKSCCIGHYEHDVKMWYEDRNWFATPIYDCKYWCDIPNLPDMDGDIDG